MSESPIAKLFEAFDKLDVEAASAMFAPDAKLLIADGRRAEGADAVRTLIADVCAGLTSTVHRITAEWRVDDIWIAEVEADYEGLECLELKGLPRACILRAGAQGTAQ